MKMQDGKKEQMRHVTMEKTPRSNGELKKSANGTSTNVRIADSMCLCLRCMNIV